MAWIGNVGLQMNNATSFNYYIFFKTVAAHVVLGLTCARFSVLVGDKVFIQDIDRITVDDENAIL